MVSKIYSAALQGLDAMVVTVEVDNFEGGNNPKFTIVGLPDSAVKESQERVQSACTQGGFWIRPSYGDRRDGFLRIADDRRG